VTLEGRPLHWGTVSFYDGNGGIHRGEIDSKGRYEVSGVPAGEAKVSVISMKEYLPDAVAKPVATFEALEENSAKMLSNEKISEAQLRAMFGATLEEQKPRKPNSRPSTPEEEPTLKEDDLSHIPMRYADITSSGLACTVELPEHVYDIDLTKEP